MYTDNGAAGFVANIQSIQNSPASTPANQQIEQASAGQKSEFLEIFGETRKIMSMTYTEFMDMAPKLSPTTQRLFSNFVNLDAQAEALSQEATKVSTMERPVAPSELVTLSLKSHEFMFHAQLTSGMANRTADGLQQLFRQQN